MSGVFSQLSITQCYIAIFVEGQSSEPAWKVDALEGDITEFPSIKDKIANMEDVGKTIGRFNVPDVTSRVKQSSTPAAGWMEARSKLQSQLDSLIAKECCQTEFFLFTLQINLNYLVLLSHMF